MAADKTAHEYTCWDMKNGRLMNIDAFKIIGVSAEETRSARVSPQEVQRA
ncbi:hypothetical protein RvY_03777 [Ramazzottius varieornatus]|uniref:Uncharacterized protein n=1 Tax=Ramazzottius varieornatus TaxID=947166 RepID=A0A1D1USW7_RAMVA|nr:hypothetical protein RvY_03777 [Ramazzottius varieornatus]